MACCGMSWFAGRGVAALALCCCGRSSRARAVGFSHAARCLDNPGLVASGTGSRVLACWAECWHVESCYVLAVRVWMLCPELL